MLGSMLQSLQLPVKVSWQLLTLPPVWPAAVLHRAWGTSIRGRSVTLPQLVQMK